MTNPHLEGLIPVAVEAFLGSTGQAHTVTQLQRDLTTTCMRAALEAALAALAGAGPVAWMLVRKRDGFIRGAYNAAPTGDQCQIAAMDGDEYRPLFDHAPAKAREGGDWYVSPQGSVCFDLDLDGDAQRQLSFIAKQDGSVSFAAYVRGQKVIGDATAPEFATAIAALATFAEGAE